ncbi:MAG: hypothetical protein GH151_04585 [Bacteroidetes bacterium]|nr:hypothetical protein [Bacteroidota bacterium]
MEVCDRELLELYAQHEAKIEAAEYRPYKEVLRELGKNFDFSPTSDELENFSVSVKNWPSFAGLIFSLILSFGGLFAFTIHNGRMKYESAKRLRTAKRIG